MGFKTVKDIRDFSKGRKLLVLKGEWEGEEVDYVEMVRKGGKIPLDKEIPGKDLLMRVKTRFGSEIDLKAGEFMWIDKKIVQDSGNN